MRVGTFTLTYTDTRQTTSSVDLFRMEKPREVGTESTTSDPAYFTVDDLSRAFALVVGVDRGQQFAAAWADLFRPCMIADRVVSLPPSFEAKALSVPVVEACHVNPHAEFAEIRDSMHGRRLLNFSPGLTSLLAAANPDVRKRFDRLGVSYARKTIDDPEKWRRMLAFLRDP